MPGTGNLNSKLNLRFLPEIPDGMRILFGDEEVAVISYHIANARAFAEGAAQALALEPEPNNPHDPNAIKVMSIYTRQLLEHRVHIGYVCEDVAGMLAKGAWNQTILPRLGNIWWGGYVRDYIVVRFDILGPGGRR
jgi:hypothetical protein